MKETLSSLLLLCFHPLWNITVQIEILYDLINLKKILQSSNHISVMNSMPKKNTIFHYKKSDL